MQRTDGSDSGGNRGSCRGHWLRTQRCDVGPSTLSSPRPNGYKESMPGWTNQGDQRVRRLPADSDIQRCSVHCPANHVDVRRER